MDSRDGQLAEIDLPAPRKLVPFVACISREEKSTFSALFGYDNPNNAKKVLQLGNLNQVTPAPRDQRQPRVFKRGRHQRVFEATSAGGDLIRHLDGKKAVATADFPVQCSAMAAMR